ncbi:Glyceraldehyde-3-phosphate dehydrogenase [Plecturocebus cupreus]
MTTVHAIIAIQKTVDGSYGKLWYEGHRALQNIILHLLVLPSLWASDTHSFPFNAGGTSSMITYFVKLISWYDNEFGYTNRVLDLTVHMVFKK